MKIKKIFTKDFWAPAIKEIFKIHKRKVEVYAISFITLSFLNIRIPDAEITHTLQVMIGSISGIFMVLFAYDTFKFMTMPSFKHEKSKENKKVA